MKDKSPQKKQKNNPKRSESVWAREVFSNGQQSLQSIIGSSPIPAFIIGKDHLIIYWNKALEELSGIKAKEVVGTGQHWRAFYKTARPCMADLLVDKFQKNIPQWYPGKFIKSKLITGAYEATDFFPELGKGESGCALPLRLFVIPRDPSSEQWKHSKTLLRRKEPRKPC